MADPDAVDSSHCWCCLHVAKVDKLRSLSGVSAHHIQLQRGIGVMVAVVYVLVIMVAQCYAVLFPANSCCWRAELGAPAGDAVALLQHGLVQSCVCGCGL